MSDFIVEGVLTADQTNAPGQNGLFFVDDASYEFVGGGAAATNGF